MFQVSSNVVSDIITNITSTIGITSQVSNNVVSDIFTDLFQSINIVLTGLFQGSVATIQNFLEFIFNKLKKYYMFINNIEE